MYCNPSFVPYYNNSCHSLCHYCPKFLVIAYFPKLTVTYCLHILWLFHIYSTCTLPPEDLSFDLLSPGKPRCILLVVCFAQYILSPVLAVKPCSALTAQALVGAPAHLMCIPDPYLMLSYNIRLKLSTQAPVQHPFSPWSLHMFITSLLHGMHLNPLCWPSVVRALVTPLNVVLIQLKTCHF